MLTGKQCNTVLISYKAAIQNTLFPLDPMHSGCLAWYMQKYFLKPFNDNTVPMQLRGLMSSFLGSGRLNVNSSLYHVMSLSRFRYANISVLFFLYGQTILWNFGNNFVRDWVSTRSRMVLQPGRNNRTKPLYVSALISCSFNCGWYVCDFELLFLFAAHSSWTRLSSNFLKSYNDIYYNEWQTQTQRSLLLLTIHWSLLHL